MICVSGKLCKYGDFSKKNTNRGKPLTDFLPLHFAEVLASRCQDLHCRSKDNNTRCCGDSLTAEFGGSQK